MWDFINRRLLFVQLMYCIVHNVYLYFCIMFICAYLCETSFRKVTVCGVGILCHVYHLYFIAL